MVTRGSLRVWGAFVGLLPPSLALAQGAGEANEFAEGLGGLFEEYRLFIVGGAGLLLVGALVMLALRGSRGPDAQEAAAERAAEAYKRATARRLVAAHQNLSKLQVILVNAGARERTDQVRELLARLARLQEYVDKADRVDERVEGPLSYLIESSDTAVSLAEGNLPRVDTELSRIKGWIAEVSSVLVTRVVA